MTPKQQIERAVAYQVMIWQFGLTDEYRQAELAEADRVIAAARSQMVEGPL